MKLLVRFLAHLPILKRRFFLSEHTELPRFCGMLLSL